MAVLLVVLRSPVTTDLVFRIIFIPSEHSLLTQISIPLRIAMLVTQPRGVVLVLLIRFLDPLGTTALEGRSLRPAVGWLDPGGAEQPPVGQSRHRV